MIETLISSKTRIKLLLKFFLNDGTRGYLRGLENELAKARMRFVWSSIGSSRPGLLVDEHVGNKRMFRANPHHPLYEQLHQIVRKHLGLDRIVDTIVAQLGQLEQVWLIGNFSRGIDGGIVDLVVVGDVDRSYLTRLVVKAEGLIERKIRYVVYTRRECEAGALTGLSPRPLLLWEAEANAVAL